MRQFETGLPAAIDRLSAAERDLVVALKFEGESDAECLAESLELSLSATRSTLSVLRMAGLVRTRRGGASSGRRRLQYSLTEEGHGLFPAAHPRIVRALAQCVAMEAPEIWGAFVDQQAGRIAGHMRRRTLGKAPREALDELARVYREGGFLVELEHQDGECAELRVYHCPFVDQARVDPGLCDREFAIIEAAGVGAIRRMAHQPSGDRCCSFLMQSRSESGSENA